MLVICSTIQSAYSLWYERILADSSFILNFSLIFLNQ